MAAMSDTLLTIVGSIVAVAALAVTVGAVVFFRTMAGRADRRRPRIAWMRVLTPAPDPAALLVSRRLGATLAPAASALQVGGEVPAILIRVNGVHLAAKTPAGDSDIDRLVTLGVGIARSVSRA
jgi:hypothetical protein